MSAEEHLNKRQFLYHGTDNVFNPGDVLQPPSVTGREATSHPDLTPEEFNNAAYVYHTSDLHQARSFGQHVYRVEPESHVETDPEADLFGGGEDTRWTRNQGSAKVVEKVRGR